MNGRLRIHAPQAWLGLVGLLVILSLASGCLGAGDGAVREALRRETADTTKTEAAVVSFYERRRYAPAWTRADGPSAAGDSLIEALCAGGNGIPARRLDAIRERLHAAFVEPPAEDRARAEAVAAAELEMSDALLEMALDHVHGRAGLAGMHDHWHYRIDTGETDAAEWLQRFARTRDFAAVLESMLHEHPDQSRLEDALDRYRRIADRGGWTPIPEGPDLDPHGSDPRLDAIRERLAATDDLQGAGGDLARGIERFRARHGLEPAEKIDRATIAAMNVPVEQRIAQLEVNLERQRWLPRMDGERVVVNIPEFRAHGYRGGREALSMRVVVGERMNQTPLFADEIAYVTFRPYWNLPVTIALDEVLPAVEDDPRYLIEKRYEVVDESGERVETVKVSGRVVVAAADGDAPPRPDRIVPVHTDAPDLAAGLESEELRVRQQPGPANALGLVKFMFPNQFNVYLHDTPADELFGRSRRDFSHGCIRLEDPAQFAEFVLAGNGDWGREAIEAAMADEEIEAKVVELERRIPVYIVYLTAWVDAEGRVQFRDDVYGHDAAVREATAGGRMGAQKREACERLQQQLAQIREHPPE